MIYKTIDKIKCGDMLAKPLFNNECSILLTANSRLTVKNIEKLKELGFKGIYVYDKPDDDSRQIDLLSDDVRQKALKSLKHINIDDCLYIANVITNTVLEKPDILYDMMSICSYDNRTYTHCINVAVLATMIGVDRNMSNAELCELAQAALLHDIGKTCLDEKLLNKAEQLTENDYNEIKRHAEYGYNMLKKDTMISENVRLGVLYHHENENGTGYPHRLSGDKIPQIAKIIHIADVYDAMISERSYKSTINPADVLEYIMGNVCIFDITLIISLIHCVALYPTGSEVLLSDGRKGIVAKNTKGFPQRPELTLADGSHINLMKELNVTIVKILT